MQPQPPLPTSPPSTAQVSELSTALSSLVESGASWSAVKTVGDATVHTLSGIRYGEDSPLQSLDVYFPDELVAQHLAPSDDQTSPLSPQQPRPVFIHIHGGGWSRGSKDNRFYGGPAMSQNAAASGSIAVAPGYRLGKYPEFINDASAAIKWVRDNIADLGGDLSNVFLSGHSAGGHIASLLVVRHSCFLAPLGIPPDFFRGLILVSGVYDLFSPLRKAPLDSKNKWFVLAYVRPAFGTDEKLRREASPLLLLEPDKDTSVLGRTATWIASSLRRYSDIKEAEATDVIDGESELNTSAPPSTPTKETEAPGDIDNSIEPSSSVTPSTATKEAEAPSVVDDRNELNSTILPSSATKEAEVPSVLDDRNEPNTSVLGSPATKETEAPAVIDNRIELNTSAIPSTIIFNAAFDMGLQENGELMAAAMAKYTDVQYKIIPRTDHASICWNAETASEVNEFIKTHSVPPQKGQKREASEGDVSLPVTTGE